MVLRPVDDVIWIIAASIGSMERPGLTRAHLARMACRTFVSGYTLFPQRPSAGEAIPGIDIKGTRRETTSVPAQGDELAVNIESNLRMLHSKSTPGAPRSSGAVRWPVSEMKERHSSSWAVPQGTRVNGTACMGARGLESGALGVGELEMQGDREVTSAQATRRRTDKQAGEVTYQQQQVIQSSGDTR